MSEISEELRQLTSELRGYETAGIDLPWLQLLNLAERLERETPLLVWWIEAGTTERHRFMEDFLELYLHDPVFTTAIDTLLGRAR